MMRAGLPALALAALSALAVPALADDAAAARPWHYEARALDYSSMLRGGHGGAGGTMSEVVLSKVPVRVLVRAPGASSSTMEARTDVDGRFVLEGAEPPPGATLEFFVAGADGDAARPGFYGRPWVVDDGAPPAAVQFYEVATEVPRAMLLQNVINVVSTVDRDETTKIVQLRHTAMLVNRDFQVWMGDVASNEFTTFGIRIPQGFELRNVTVNNQEADKTDIAHDGHGAEERWVYRQPIFPEMGRPLMFQAMFVAPYEEGREYDISWHNEYPVLQYTMNIEKGLFSYLPPDEDERGVGLADGGMNPAMGNTKKITHSYGLSQIPPHQNLLAHFVAGRPFPWHAVKWVGAILFLALGAALLGWVSSRPRAERRAAEIAARAGKRKAASAGPKDHERELEMLARRLRRGEITSVEHEVRKAAIVEAMRGAEHGSGQGAAQAPAPPVDDVAAIAARVDTADAEQLRADVRALLERVGARRPVR